MNAAATRSKRYYLATVRGKIVQVTAGGMTLAPEVAQGVDRVSRWALVSAASLREARAKYLRGDVVIWQS